MAYDSYQNESGYRTLKTFAIEFYLIRPNIQNLNYREHTGMTLSVQPLIDVVSTSCCLKIVKISFLSVNIANITSKELYNEINVCFCLQKHMSPSSCRLNPLAVSIMSTEQLHKIQLRGCRKVILTNSENLN